MAKRHDEDILYKQWLNDTTKILYKQWLNDTTKIYYINNG